MNAEQRAVDANALLQADFQDYSNTDVKYAIDHAPTIDAVEVVRCKECKYTAHSKVNPDVLVCCLTKICGTTDKDWFCADGERSDT